MNFGSRLNKIESSMNKSNRLNDEDGISTFDVLTIFSLRDSINNNGLERIKRNKWEVYKEMSLRVVESQEDREKKLEELKQWEQHIKDIGGFEDEV